MISLSARLFAIAAMEPESSQGVALNLLAEQLSTDEKRKGKQAARKAKSRARKCDCHAPRDCHVTVTPIEQNQILNQVTVTLSESGSLSYVEPMYVKPMYVEEKEVT